MMQNYFDDFETTMQVDELDNPSDNFDWDEYYVDEPNKIDDDSDMDPGYVDLDWLYEELNTYNIDGDF
jgi:hypothetical protein